MKYMAWCAAVFMAWTLTGAASTAASEDPALRAAIAGSHRSPDFVARDGARHPYETLDFFGIRPDMTVVEIWPGAGWYTEILAPYLRERGKLYAAHFAADAGAPYFRELRADFLRKLADAPTLYDRIEVTEFDPPHAVAIAPPASADLVLTFRNVHNWTMRGGGEERTLAAFAAMYAALRPGGILGVVDHRLPANRPLADQEESGYLREDFVIGVAQRAGFQLVAKSGINANPRDHADHPGGVWNLPPALRGDAAKREQYLAIGESDRMTLKFIKPNH